ncbi:hypothetical protein [Paenibacillus dakarensis]|uniref:hypothetical protein n=1 Tax=Paenibacillus dakarensis TaxID=1527293 RepID=UPI0006D5B58E|nr:hypothetical protein [Paenibacillus dakarensis]
MSLAEWIETIFGSMEGLLAVMLAAAVFLGLYIYCAARLRASRTEMLERIRQSLTLYTQLAGPLTAVIERSEDTTEPDESLVSHLQECKAADRLTGDLLKQIDTYLQDRDNTRLPQISRTLEREMKRLVQERSIILRRIENPGWGIGLWMLLKPAIPGLSFYAAVLWTFNLISRLRNPEAWSDFSVWALWLSCMIATVSFYRLLMDSKRRSLGVIFYGLHLLIAAAALINLVSFQASPYVLAAQIVLYLTGFWFTSSTRSRSERPYAGNLELMETYAGQSSAGSEDSKRTDEAYTSYPHPLSPRDSGAGGKSRS